MQEFDSSKYDYTLETFMCNLPSFWHTLFFMHVRNGSVVKDESVMQGDYVIKAECGYTGYIFTSYHVTDIYDDYILCMNKVDSKDCIVDSMLTAEDVFRLEMRDYMNEMSQLPLEVAYSCKVSNKVDILELEISPETVLVENGEVIKIIENLCMQDLQNDKPARKKFSCDVKEGMLIAKRKEDYIQYNLVQSVHALSGMIILRDVPSWSIGRDITCEVESAIHTQDRFYTHL